MGERLVSVGYDIYFSTFPGNDFLNRYSYGGSIQSVDILIEMTDWSDVQKDILYKRFIVRGPDIEYKNGYSGFDGGVDSLSMINKTYAYKTNTLILTNDLQKCCL